MESFESRVRYSELAEDKKISLVSIINYFQDSCNFESERKNVGLEYLSKNKTAWLLTSWQIRINRRPGLDESIKATTWATGFRRFIGQRCFTLTDGADEVYAYAYSEWAYINMELGKPAIVPEEEAAAYSASPVFDYEIKKGKIKIPENLTEAGSVTINKCYIDTNHHVNNGQYINIASMYIPEDFDIKGLRAEYKGQSRLGDTLIAKTAESENGIVVVLFDEAENIRLVAEFENK